MLRICIHMFILLFFTSIISLQKMYAFTSQEPKKIIVFGAGYVGTVYGACLAACGHKVTFIETNKEKVAVLNAQKSCIREPYIEELIGRGVEHNVLEAKLSVGEEIRDADIAIITVATPTSHDGVAQLDCVENVLALLKDRTQTRNTPLVVSISSTILPHFFRQLKSIYFNQNEHMKLVINPVFIRESTAVEDFFNPSFCVAGGDDPCAVESVLSLFKEITPKRFAVSGETACLIKYACNAYHATKIVFANEMASLCDSLDIDSAALMSLFSEDTLLNCSAAYLKPGFSFGGPCLSKDLKALLSFGNQLGNSLPLLSAVIPSNQNRFQKIMNKILQGNHRKLAIFGISFKKNSDDLRESPFVDLIHRLRQQGIDVHIFDSEVDFERLKNVDPSFFDGCVGALESCVAHDVSTALEGCDGVVLCKDLLTASVLDQLEKNHIPIYNLGYFALKKNCTDPN